VVLLLCGVNRLVVRFGSSKTLSSWAAGGFCRPETRLPKRSYHPSGPSPIRSDECWTCLDNGATRAEAPGHQQGSLVVGLFKEEGEMGIASDVVKVKGDNPVTPQFSKGGIGRGVTSAILNRGSIPPWLTREDTLGP